MPDSVPPAIGNSFASVVPYAVCMGFCWFIRTLLNIDVVAVLMGLPSSRNLHRRRARRLRLAPVPRHILVCES